jgi:phosphopentomutase
MARFVVLVIDSFGVGAMADVPEGGRRISVRIPAGIFCNAFPALRLPTLEKLGLINALGFAPGVMQLSEDAVWGTAELEHEGGDTFMGHQEIFGTKPRTPLRMPFNAVIDKVEDALLAAGHQTERHGKGPFWLLVDGAVAVGDNLEADLGQVYNITGNLSEKTLLR